jgi:hypothetical protein
MAEVARETYMLAGVPPQLLRQWDEFLKKTGPRQDREEVMLAIHATSFFRYLLDPVNGKGIHPNELSLAMLGDAEVVNDYLRFLDIQVGSLHHTAQGVLPDLSEQVAHFKGTERGLPVNVEK